MTCERLSMGLKCWNVWSKIYVPVFLLVSSTASSNTTNQFDPLLFMDLIDVNDTWGLIWPTANTVQEDESLQSPPVNYSMGDQVIATIQSAIDPSVFEIYVENTTGIEPLFHQNKDRAGNNPTNATNAQLIRFTTKDFVTYSPGQVVLSVNKGGAPTMKSIARSTDGSLYVLFTVLHGYTTFTSVDQGRTWNPTNTTGFHNFSCYSAYAYH